MHDKRILIIGTNEAAKNLFLEFKQKGLESCIIGFIGNNIDLSWLFENKKIIGTINTLKTAIDEWKINQILIVKSSFTMNHIQDIVIGVLNYNSRINITIIHEDEKYFSSYPMKPTLKEIYLSDIIDRDEYNIDSNLIRHQFKDKVILITGAGGSIGSQMCQYILKFEVKKLIAIGRGENSIYELNKDLKEYKEKSNIKTRIVYKILDIKDKNLLEKLFEHEKPDIVFHTAAHKHVPLMEKNEAEAFQNNVMGTYNVLEASYKNDVEKFILISTDKAVQPISIMGSTKRIAELLTLYYYNKGLTAAIVRFGNVTGSRGSVIPLFKEQIEKGGPVTVTDPNAKRYFMSIFEAVLLAINAAAYTQGGETFVLNMGKQYRILDIAKKIIRMYGYEPETDIKIQFTGLRPGEKLQEELFYNDQLLIKTKNNKIFILQNSNSDFLTLEEMIRNFSEISACSAVEIRKIIKEIVCANEGAMIY